MPDGIARSMIGREFDRTVLDPITPEEIREYSEVSGEPSGT